MKTKIREFVAAMDNIYGKWRGPFLCRLDREEGILYWGLGGYSHMNIPPDDQFMVVKSYGFFDDEDDDMYDTVEEIRIQFYRDDFPPQPEIKDSAGWLSPEGLFYPCEYGGHLELSYELCIMLNYDNTYSRDFEDRGWLRVDAEYIPFRKDTTQAQLVTLLKLWCLPGEYLSKEELKQTLNYHGWKVK